MPNVHVKGYLQAQHAFFLSDLTILKEIYSHTKCSIVFENWIMHNEVTGTVILLLKWPLYIPVNFNFNGDSCQNPLGRHLDKGLEFVLVRC